jgi:hypothetical protein
MPATCSEPNTTVRKPRTISKPYAQTPGPAKGSQLHSAPKKTKKSTCLTKGQWVLEVFPWHDTHPQASQYDIVQYFANCRDVDGGPLPFDQATLSQNLNPVRRSQLETEVASFANGANSKQRNNTLCPQVDQALLKWFLDLEAQNEVITGPMLSEKRTCFEDGFDVPLNQRPKSNGWQGPWKLWCVLIQNKMLL